MTELTLRDFNAIASGSYNAGIVDYRENANGKIELINIKFQKNYTNSSQHFLP